MKNIFFIVIAVLISSCATDSYRSFQFKYEVTLEPTNGEKMEMWIPIPQTTPIQTISNLTYNMSGLNYELKKEEAHNNTYLYVYNDKGISESKTISVVFDVTRKEHSNYEMYEDVDPDKYLGAYSKVPIGNIFQSIINKNNLTSTNMEGVYEFVLSGMHYGKPTDDENSGNYKYVHGGINPKTGKEWLPSNITYGLKKKTRDELTKSQNKSKQYAYGNGNSLYACDIGVGNCTDYHSYFMSLGRTLNVPVRFHMGFPIPSGDGGKVKGYHCWADYFVEDKGWWPVDISEADKDPKLADYFFGNIDNSRVDMMIGRDFILDNYDNGKLNLFIYPILEINDKPSTGFKKNFSYKEI